MIKRFIISITLALKNLRNNRGRTVLTLVGVIIGIMSVIVVSSSGQGVKEYILGQMDVFSSDMIQVETKVPATGKTSASNATGQAMGIQITTLKPADGDAIEKLPNVKEIAPGTMGQEIVSYRNENKRALLYGNGANYFNIDEGAKLASGAYYTQQDDDSLAQVVVIGWDVKEALFGDDEAVGKTVKIKGMEFKVVGVIEKRGSVTFFNYDELVYLPVNTLTKKILGVDYVRYIMVKVDDVNMIEVTALDVTDLLRKRHKIDNPNQDDFAVTSMVEARKLIEDVFGTINILLLALTSISLIVGGVGIMNVMYVAVVERTFEIGLRKAVGARESDIRNQFLLEAVIITLMGGIVGIVLGFLVSLAFSSLLAALGFTLHFSITANSILLATGFSTATGVVFGYYPAYKASKLSPMEALRKE